MLGFQRGHAANLGGASAGGVDGVKRVHVISYKSPDAILAEVFTNEGTGTLVVADVQKLAPAELAAGGPASA